MAVIWFVLQILFFGLCLGAGISVIIFVPLSIYIIPYRLWIGFQNQVGKHKEKRNEKLFKTARNATILYKSWILHREPTF